MRELLPFGPFLHGPYGSASRGAQTVVKSTKLTFMIAAVSSIPEDSLSSLRSSPFSRAVSLTLSLRISASCSLRSICSLLRGRLSQLSSWQAPSLLLLLLLRLLRLNCIAWTFRANRWKAGIVKGTNDRWSFLPLYFPPSNFTPPVAPADPRINRFIHLHNYRWCARVLFRSKFSNAWIWRIANAWDKYRDKPFLTGKLKT